MTTQSGDFVRQVQPMPKPPEGFAACRTGYGPQITHLVILDSTGSNGGRPTLCRLTRFPARGTNGETLLEADIAGWSMGGGVEGPGVRQVECHVCYDRLGQLASIARIQSEGSQS